MDAPADNYRDSELLHSLMALTGKRDLKEGAAEVELGPHTPIT